MKLLLIILINVLTGLIHNIYASPSLDSVVNYLNIGDDLPEELLKRSFETVDKDGNIETVNLQTESDQLIILDFWATWCGPCIRSLQELDILKRQFGKELIIIPSSYESQDKVSAFLAQQDLDLPSIFGQEVFDFMSMFFYIKSIPTQIWIRNGKVIAIPHSQYAQKEIVTQLLENKPVQLFMKNDDPESKKRSAFIEDENDSRKLYEVVFESMFPVNIGGTSRSENWLYGYNMTYYQMLKEAFTYEISIQDIEKVTIWDVDEKIKSTLIAPEIYSFVGNYLQDSILQKWREENTFTYSVGVAKNPKQNRVYMYEIFRNELNQFFRFNRKVAFSVEEQKRNVLVLKKIKNNNGKLYIDPITKENKNEYISISERPIKYLLGGLKSEFKNSPFIVVDETGINHTITIQLKKAGGDINLMRQQLQKCGFDLVKKKRKVKVVRISQVKS